MSGAFNDFGSDPFGSVTDKSFVPDVSRTSVEQSDDRLLLPIVLAVLVCIGTLMPWVIVRPFDGDRRTFNVTDMPGGVAILISIILVALVGAVVAVFRRRAGLTVVSLAVATLGWMAAISGLLLSFITSIVPAVGAVGIDLAKASVGQGSGVVVTVLSSLTLAFLVVRRYEPFARYSPDFQLPIIPALAIVPLVILASNIHTVWLELVSPAVDYHIAIPGDALYGSGLLAIAIWICIGLWFASAIIRRHVVSVVAAVTSMLIGIAAILYGLLAWLGGKAIVWLLPSKVEGYGTVQTRPTIFLLIFVSICLVALAVVGALESFSMRQVELKKSISVFGWHPATSDLVALGLLTVGILALISSRLIS